MIKSRFYVVIKFILILSGVFCRCVEFLTFFIPFFSVRSMQFRSSFFFFSSNMHYLLLSKICSIFYCVRSGASSSQKNLQIAFRFSVWWWCCCCYLYENFKTCFLWRPIFLLRLLSPLFSYSIQALYTQRGRPPTSALSLRGLIYARSPRHVRFSHHGYLKKTTHPHITHHNTFRYIRDHHSTYKHLHNTFMSSYYTPVIVLSLLGLM